MQQQENIRNVYTMLNIFCLAFCRTPEFTRSLRDASAGFMSAINQYSRLVVTMKATQKATLHVSLKISLVRNKHLTVMAAFI